jgi:predicted RNA-binding Zn ribbon-like protein
VDPETDAAPLGFPAAWLADPGRPATDVELALLLINSLDLLEEPADRLSDLTWLTQAFTRARHEALADELTPRDLPRLRTLRDALRPVFESSTDGAAAAILNSLLEKADAILSLDVDQDGVTALKVGVGRRGISALESRLPAALATFIAEHGVRRLGTCGSDPCRCVFVDHTRAATRKYCCTYCNDRNAARAYRQRKKR